MLATAVFLIVVAAGVSIIWTSLTVGISPMPTSPAVRRAMLQLMPSETRGEVHELGAGWGTLAFPLADRYPSSTVVAWERSWVPYAFCWLRQRLRPRRNLVLRRESFDVANLRGASLVVCYLFPRAMERLDVKFAQELSTGAIVVSNSFALRQRKPSASRVVDDLYRTRVLRYDWRDDEASSAPPP